MEGLRLSLLYVALLHALHGLTPAVDAADNGLAIVPPRGWLGWTNFRCQIRCDFDPRNCIHERLFMEIADAMAADGWVEAGYTYLNLDDCWQLQQLVTVPTSLLQFVRFERD